jgi:hypothetical protein
VTHDTALFGGVIVGCLAALIYRRINRHSLSILTVS